MWSSVIKTHKGAWLGGVSSRVTVLYHAITNAHMYVKVIVINAELSSVNRQWFSVFYLFCNKLSLGLKA